MAKRRSVRQTSSRKKSTRGGGSSGWKKSTGLAALLIFFIILLWVFMIYKTFFQPNSGMPGIKNFPFQFMTEDAKEPFEIVADTDDPKRPRAPFIIQEGENKGKIAWEAWVCRNPMCPYRKKFNKPFVFPNVIKYYKDRHEAGKPLQPTPEEMKAMEEKGEMMMFDGIDMSQCPVCKKYKKDAFQTDRYNTDKGLQLLEERRKKLKEAQENK